MPTKEQWAKIRAEKEKSNLGVDLGNAKAIVSDSVSKFIRGQVLKHRTIKGLVNLTVISVLENKRYECRFLWQDEIMTDVFIEEELE